MMGIGERTHHWTASKRTINWIHYQRVSAAFAIVVLHVSAGVVIGDKGNRIAWWAGNLYDSFVRWGVPAFVMISGTLLLGLDKTENMTEYYKNRVNRILPPLLFWTLFYKILSILSARWRGEPTDVFMLCKKILVEEPYTHLWFLYMIFGLYILAPFLKRVIGKLPADKLRLLIVLAFSIVILVELANEFYFSLKLSFWLLRYIVIAIKFVPYFVFAYYAFKTELWERMRMPGLISIFLILFGLNSVGCYLLTEKTNIDVGQYFYNNFSVFVVPMSLAAYLIFPKLSFCNVDRPFVKKLSAVTLGVYAIHPFIIRVLSALGLSTSTFTPACSILLVSVVTFGISVVACFALLHLPIMRRCV
jgi:surface polysaccharide O-acyltransferase-like enzyme